MPKPPPQFRKPDALELFTDREPEQVILRRVLAPARGLPEEASLLVTSFYGVGGVGKSTLCRRAAAIARQECPGVTLAWTSFDDRRWTPSSGFAQAAAELCRVFQAEGVGVELSAALLAIWHQAAGQPGGIEERWQLALDVVDKGVEMAGIPGLSLLVKGALHLRDQARRREIRARLEQLDLWPADPRGEVTQADVERRLPLALYHDVHDWLQRDPGRQLRLLLDGFERIQGRENRADAQRGLSEFCGYFADPDQADARARFRVVIFGRDKLGWDEVYQDPTWGRHWTQHILGGLGENDARAFLRKAADWRERQGRPAAARALLDAQDRILDASDERLGGQRLFHPYSLDLAIDMMDRAGGAPVDLGRTPAELQERFLRYLEPREQRALMVLAMAETFGEAFFDWLAKERLVDYAQNTFRSQLVAGHSYFQEVPGRPGMWRFHRMMEAELQKAWLKAGTREEGRRMVERLLGYHGQVIGDRPEKDWGATEIEAWKMGMEILVTQGPELGLLEPVEWQATLRERPWAVEHYLCLKALIDFQQRILVGAENAFGPEHPDTLRSVNNLALLLKTQGDSAGAGVLSRRVLAGCEKALGAEHPDTLSSVNNLAILLNTQGDSAGAAVLYRRALAGREKALGLEHPDTLMSVNNLANLLRTQGDYAGAGVLYRRALAGCEKALGPEHPYTLMSVNNLANLVSDQGDTAGAAVLYRRALAGCEKVLGPEHPNTLHSVNNLAVLLQAKGDNAGAEVLYRRALAGLEKAWGPEHPDALMGVSNLADLLQAKGDHAEAEALHRRALAGREKVLGPGHPSTLVSVGNLANLLQAKADHAEAEALHRRALAGREKALGPEHPDTSMSVNNLAVLLSAQGDYAEAGVLYRRALAGREKALGPEHLDTLSSVNNLANLLSAQGDYAGAGVLYRRALAGREKALGPEHPDTLSSVNNLAILLRDQGDTAGAEVLSRRALAGREKGLGPEHPDTLMSVNNLAVLLSAQGDYAEAGVLYRRALAGYEKALGLEHPYTLSSVNNLANLLSSQGDSAGAGVLYRRALAGYEKALGPEHPDTLGSVNNLANLLSAQGDTAGAEVLYRRALAGREKALGPEHPDTLSSVNNLAIHLIERGDSAGAEALFRQAIAGREKVLGPEHPDTLVSVKVLSLSLNALGRLPDAVQLLRQKAALSPAALAAVRYNLACYECLSGNHNEARRLIAEEVAARPGARQQALQDDDLKAIRDFIQTL